MYSDMYFTLICKIYERSLIFTFESNSSGIIVNNLYFVQLDKLRFTKNKGFQSISLIKVNQLKGLYLICFC